MSGQFTIDGFLRRFDAADAQLVAKGFHNTSPWWRAELERFLRSGRRRWVIRAGRRAGKSSFLCRLAVAWALWGPWSIPAGDVAVIPFVSVDRSEAGARLRTVRDILSALGIAADVRAEEIELTHRPCIFQVRTCSLKGVVGFTAIMLVSDEMARWEAKDTAANPASEVMASLRPTTATQPFALEVCSSSPWSTDDYHCQLFDEGDNEHQCVSFAPSWIANPSITEAFTHELEPDERVWRREYAAIPGGATSAAVDSSDVATAYAQPIPTQRGTPWLAIDPSSLRHDAFGVVLGRELLDGTIIVDDVGGLTGEDLRSASMFDVVAAVAAEARKLGTATVFTDQREAASLLSMFERENIRLEVVTWTDKTKADAFLILRRLLVERRFVVACREDERLKRDMLRCKVKLSPSGRELYMTNGLDYLACVITYLTARSSSLATLGGLDDCPLTAELLDIATI